MAQQKQQQQRRQNQRQNKQKQNNPRGNKGANKKKPPNPVTGPPTWKDINRETRAATNTKFRPLERAIGAEVRASKQRTRQEGDWWNNYLEEVKGVQGQTQAAYDQAAATTQGFINQTGAIDAAQSDKLQAEANANAALRGAAPSTEAANREAAGSAQRQYLSAAYGGKNAAEGASQRSYLGQKQLIGLGQKIASRNEEERRTRGFEKDRRDTRGERGAYAATKRGEERDKAREYAIQQRAFPQKKAELAQQERESAADRRIAQQNANSSTRSSRASAKNAQTTAETAGKTGGLTPSEKHGKEASWNNAKSTAQTLYDRGRGFKKPSGETVYGEKWPYQSWAELIADVEAAAEVPPAMARRAVERLRKRTEGSRGGPSGVPANESNPAGH